jgi:hypothetical protein
MTGRFDARAYWDGLTPDKQRAIGELAILLLVADDADPDLAANPAVVTRWEHARDEAQGRIDTLLPVAEDFPDGPDLAALDIRACRVCGCTDDNACADGCAWIDGDEEENLCTRCAVMISVEAVQTPVERTIVHYDTAPGAAGPPVAVSEHAVGAPCPICDAHQHP